MSEIREDLVLADKFSQTFKQFDRAASDATISADSFKGSLDNLEDTTVFNLANAFEQVRAQIERSGDAIKDVLQSQKQVTNETRNTASEANNWMSSIKSIAASLGAVKLAKTFIETSDEMSMMTAKLNAINDGLQTTEELNKMIFASAQRSRGAYQDTADLVTRLRMNAGEAFQSNAEAVLFAENLNKSFKIAGATQQEQASVILQLSQAMSSGILRGQEFNAVMSGAPNVIRLIAEEMGVGVGEMRKMAEEGKITAGIVKNALLNATDEITESFGEMPMTFADMIQEGKNEIQFALADAFSGWSEYINTDEWQSMMQSVTQAMVAAAKLGVQALMAVAKAIAWVRDNWAALSPFIYTVVAAMIAFKVASLGAAIASAAAWAISHWYIFALGILLVQLAQSLGKLGVSFSDVGAVIGGVFGGLYAIVHNIFADIWNVIAVFVEFFVNVWVDPLGAIVRMFVGLADTVLAVLETIADAMDWVFGSNMGGTIASWRKDMQTWADNKFGKNQVQVDRMEHINATDTSMTFAIKGAQIADKLEKTASEIADAFSVSGDVTDSLSGLGDLEDLVNAVGPTGEVANVGTVGEIKKDVNLSDEDLKIFRDLAEMKYMAKVELKTLAPNINVTVPETETGTLSAEDVANAIKVVLVEEMSSHTATAH